ncbi:hypothetical protein AAY473_018143, partial [Plecturocebus cupreus]
MLATDKREEEEAQEAQGLLWTTRLNERGESSSDMLADSHRGPSDTGPLSPLWEKELLEMIFHQGFPRSTTCSICNEKCVSTEGFSSLPSPKTWILTPTSTPE